MLCFAIVIDFNPRYSQFIYCYVWRYVYCRRF